MSSDDILPDRKETKLLNLCGLWKRTSLAGNPYLRGKLGGAVVLIMPNKYKTQDNQPDLIMYLAPPTPKDKDKEAPGDEPLVDAPRISVEALDDDIPF